MNNFEQHYNRELDEMELQVIKLENKLYDPRIDNKFKKSIEEQIMDLQDAINDVYRALNKSEVSNATSIPD
jgi:hypothetical protein